MVEPGGQGGRRSALSADAPDLFGRDAELGAIRWLLEPRDRPAGLIIAGEAGIGKTALWDAAVALGEAGSWRVLFCRPTAAEAHLPFSGLRDLLASLAIDRISSLPARQASALAAALLIGEGEATRDPGLVGLATLGIVRELAASDRLLLAIDDGQWLDPETKAALAHTVRRLHSERVTLVQTLRSPHRDPLELERAGRTWAIRRLEAGPLDTDTLHAIIRSRLGVAVARPTMLRVGEISGGNPFFAMELIRSLPTTVGRVATQTVPLPRNLLGLVESRVRAMETPVREVLAAAAALAVPTLSLIRLTFVDGAEALAAAERNDIVRLDGERIRFAHPLLATAALEIQTSLDRARLHRRLAAVVNDPEQRAHHLAEGTLAPDEEVATELEVTAAASAARGAPRAAADLLEHAVRLTPPESAPLSRRKLNAALMHFAAGNQDRSRSVFAELRLGLPPGPERARVLVENVAVSGEAGLAIELAEQAIAEAAGDTAILADANRWLSQGWLHAGDLNRALHHARLAADLAETLDDDVRLVQCLGTLAQFEGFTGQITPGLLERAVELEERTPGALLHHSPAHFLGVRLMWNDRLAAGRVLLERALARADDEGPEPDRAIELYSLADLEIRAGNWTRADAYATALYELDAQIFGLNERSYFVRALVSTHLGRVDDARATLFQDEAEALGIPEARTYFQVLCRWVLGLLELSLDNLPRAAEVLGPLPGVLERMGYRNPGARPVLPDAIEALIGVGRLAEAHSWAEKLAAQAAEFDNPWALASAARCFALLAATAGDTPTALTAFETALEHHQRSENPFARARTMLALGATLRRAKQKRAARETLVQALEAFDTLGAAVWAEKTAAELARIGGRTPAGGGLTSTEQRIAELIAQGRPNKEIAAQLYVTVRTVETHVRHIYSKLGCRSRAELAGRIARESRPS
jgi:DNA-binding CsgD family transcriptional regulator